MLPLDGQKSRSLESANDAKTGEQSVFGQHMRLERHKVPYNTDYGLINKVYSS